MCPESDGSSASAGRTFLVTGRDGQIGYELRRALAPLGHVIAPTLEELDFTRPDSIRAVVRASRPAVIVNAAAYTAVDRAESEPALCSAINADAPGLLAEEAERVGAVLVHYSTDYVFDGTKGTPYVETDAPNPLNVYGATKLAGEQAIASASSVFLILRTARVYGARGDNFMRTMMRFAREKPELRVVCDQVGAPTWSRSLAEATALVLARLLGVDGLPPGEAVAPWSGIYHLTAAGITSWYEFARAILEADPNRAAHRCTSLVPVPASEYPTLARRPPNSALDNGKLREKLGLALPHWREQLALVMEDLA
jgi:dTDP-4-dehydrorhamnose reductase